MTFSVLFHASSGILDNGHTHSDNHNVVFQWSISHSALKSLSGRGFEARGNYGVTELTELLIGLFNSLVCSLYRVRKKNLVPFMFKLAANL